MTSGRKRVFLLGGTGFIGSAVTRQLAADRAATELAMLVHRTAPLRELEQVNTTMGSLRNLDLAMLDRFKPDTVVHLARMSGRGRVGRWWAAWQGTRANRRLAANLRRREKPPHVIYVSGSLVYGDAGTAPVDESSPLRPIAFAREYINAERPWMEAAEDGTLPATILRPPWIFGRASWFGQIYLQSIKTHGSVPLFGDGENLMSLLDVEDCAGLIRHAMEHAQPGRCYNLFAPGACITQREFAERLSRATGCPVWQLTDADVRHRYGAAMLEAVTFSSRMATQYPEFIDGYAFKFPTVDHMIWHNLALPDAARQA